MFGMIVKLVFQGKGEVRINFSLGWDLLSILSHAYTCFAKGFSLSMTEMKGEIQTGHHFVLDMGTN